MQIFISKSLEVERYNFGIIDQVGLSFFDRNSDPNLKGRLGL